jgi:hypothetical protein
VTKPIRLLSALAAVFFAAVALTACGGGTSSNAVAQVGPTPITRQGFNHWMAVAAVSSVGTTGKPVAPEPPNYTACIAHDEAIAPTPAKRQSKETAAKYKAQCERQYTALKEKVLDFLISSDWVLGEGTSLGVKLTDAEVKKQFGKIKSEQFPKASEFEKFLTTSGETVSDLLLRVKLNMLSQKIQQKVVAGLAARPAQAVLRAFLATFQKKWKAKTNCSLGYIVADCRQYTGPTLSTTTLG